MRSSPPSLRRLLPAYLPLVPSTIMRSRRQVQRVRHEKFPAVAAPPTSSVPPPGSEYHCAWSETGTASTRSEVPRRLGATHLRRTSPWSRTPLCVFGDRYIEYEMRTLPPSLRRLVPEPWSRSQLCVPGHRYSEYEMRCSLPSIPPRILQTRRPILAFPRGNI